NVTLGSDSLRQADCGLPGAGSQVEHLHSRTRLREFHQRLGKRSSHGGGLCLPLLGRNQPVGSTPRGLRIGHSCHLLSPGSINSLGRLSAASGLGDPKQVRPFFDAHRPHVYVGASLPAPPAPFASPTSTGVPDHKTCAPFRKIRARRNPRSPAAPIPPVDTLRRGWGAIRSFPTVLLLRRKWPGSAADCCRCRRRS